MLSDIFAAYPPEYRRPLLRLRELIYATATDTPGVGPIEESLKWGQPTYSTVATKAGTPIRLDRFEDDKIALFVHCQTDLVENWRTMFGDTLAFSKNRAIVLDPREELPLSELALCIEMALTYHLRNDK